MATAWLDAEAPEEYFLEADPLAWEWWPNGHAKTMLLTTVRPRLVQRQVKVNDQGVAMRTALTALRIGGVPATVPGRRCLERKGDGRGDGAGSSGSAAWRNNRSRTPCQAGDDPLWANYRASGGREDEWRASGSSGWREDQWQSGWNARPGHDESDWEVPVPFSAWPHPPPPPAPVHEAPPTLVPQAMAEDTAPLPASPKAPPTPTPVPAPQAKPTPPSPPKAKPTPPSPPKAAPPSPPKAAPPTPGPVALRLAAAFSELFGNDLPETVLAPPEEDVVMAPNVDDGGLPELKTPPPEEDDENMPWSIDTVPEPPPAAMEVDTVGHAEPPLPPMPMVPPVSLFRTGRWKATTRTGPPPLPASEPAPSRPSANSVPLPLPLPQPILLPEAVPQAARFKPPPPAVDLQPQAEPEPQAARFKAPPPGVDLQPRAPPPTPAPMAWPISRASRPSSRAGSRRASCPSITMLNCARTW